MGNSSIGRRLGWGIAFAGAAAGCTAPQAGVDDSSQANLTVGEGPFAFVPGAETAKTPHLPNAYWSARLAALAYEDEPVVRKTLTDWQVVSSITDDNFRFFDTKAIEAWVKADNKKEPVFDTQAFYVKTAKEGFLVFRGTKGTGSQDDFKTAPDWRTNFMNDKISTFSPLGQVHKGFATAFRAMWDRAVVVDDSATTTRTVAGLNGRDFIAQRHVQPKTPGAPALPLYIIGHSLGGALATLAAYAAAFDGCRSSTTWDPKVPDSCLKQTIPVTATYTFGQPMVGTKLFADNLAERLRTLRSPYFRVVNGRDSVPWSNDPDAQHVGDNNFLVYFPVFPVLPPLITCGPSPIADSDRKTITAQTVPANAVFFHGIDNYVKRLDQAASDPTSKCTLP